MKKKTNGNLKFYVLAALLILVAFTPPDNNSGKLKQLADSINYYRNNTIVNWDLIRRRIK